MNAESMTDESPVPGEDEVVRVIPGHHAFLSKGIPVFERLVNVDKPVGQGRSVCNSTSELAAAWAASEPKKSMLKFCFVLASSQMRIRHVKTISSTIAGLARTSKGPCHFCSMPLPVLEL